MNQYCNDNSKQRTEQTVFTFLAIYLFLFAMTFAPIYYFLNKYFLFMLLIAIFCLITILYLGIKQINQQEDQYFLGGEQE